MHCTNFQNAQQIEKLFEAYHDYEKESGLKISNSKMVIPRRNTPDEQLEEIHRTTGIRVVDGFRYLGLEIRKVM